MTYQYGARASRPTRVCSLHLRSLLIRTSMPIVRVWRPGPCSAPCQRSATRAAVPVRQAPSRPAPAAVYALPPCRQQRSLVHGGRICSLSRRPYYPCLADKSPTPQLRAAAAPTHPRLLPPSQAAPAPSAASAAPPCFRRCFFVGLPLAPLVQGAQQGQVGPHRWRRGYAARPAPVGVTHRVRSRAV